MRARTTALVGSKRRFIPPLTCAEPSDCPTTANITRWRLPGIASSTAGSSPRRSSASTTRSGTCSRYERWWTDFVIRATGDSPPPEPGKSNELLVKAYLPYKVNFVLTVVEAERPRRILSRISKDFDGTGEWTLEEQDGVTVATLDWRPTVNQPFIRYLSPLLRPLFRSNHKWAMRRGERQIREYLACVSSAPASGTGRRRIPTGTPSSGGPRSSPRTRSSSGDDFVLFDPLAVPDELRERATAVVLTAPYHERDARGLGLPIHTPPADTWEDWVEKFGIDPDKVRGMESEDLAWLRAGEGEGEFHGPGPWPFGITPTRAARRTTWSSGSRRVNAIVSSDSLSDFGDGLGIQMGGRKHLRPETGRRAAPPTPRPAGRARPTGAR